MNWEGNSRGRLGDITEEHDFGNSAGATDERTSRNEEELQGEEPPELDYKYRMPRTMNSVKEGLNQWEDSEAPEHAEQYDFEDQEADKYPQTLNKPN